MTTVVALAENGTVAMAGDSMTNVYERPISGAVKVRRLDLEGGGWALVGVRGNGALGDLLGYRLQLAALPSDAADPQADLQPWAARAAWAMTELCREAGVVDDQHIDGLVLLGAAGRLWTIANYMAIPHPDGLAALGTGEGPAIGALAVLDPTLSITERVSTALQTAARFDRYTAAPFHLEVLVDPAGRA